MNWDTRLWGISHQTSSVLFGDLNEGAVHMGQSLLWQLTLTVSAGSISIFLTLGYG